MLFSWPFGESRGSWDPSVPPAEIRRRHEAAKRDRERQAAARQAEIQRSIAETQSFSPFRSTARAGRGHNKVTDLNAFSPRTYWRAREQSRSGGAR